MSKYGINIKYLIILLLFFVPGNSLSQIKIFTTDSINLTEWNYNQRKIVRSPEIGIIAESKNEIFFSYDLNDPVKIFDGKNASLAVDSSSIIHIVFQDNGIRYALKPATGDWQQDIQISNISEEGSFPIADCDKDGSVHIVYGVSDPGNKYLSSLKYVKVSDNQKQISSTIYEMNVEDSPHTLVNYTIANHLLFSDRTVFIAYQLSNDSIYLKYSVDNGLTWMHGGQFRGTDPKLSVGPGQHWSDQLIEYAVFPVLLFRDMEGNLTNSFAEFHISAYDTSIWWMGENRIQDGPIDGFCIDDVIGPFGYSYIFQKDGVLYHAFSGLSRSTIMDTITNIAIVSSIAYKQFDRFKVDIVWFEKNDGMYEMYYQWFEKIPAPPKLKLTSTQSDIVCYGASDGFIKTDVTGGNPPYKYQWSTGDTVKDISNLSAGTYSLIITDSILHPFPIPSSNSIYAFFEIFESSQVETSEITGLTQASTSDIIVYTVSGTPGSVFDWTVTGGNLLAGQGSNSVNIQWGDPGSGKISVIETNKDGCKGDTVSTDVSIVMSVNPAEIQPFKIYPNPFSNNTKIQFPYPASEPYQLSIITLAGKTVKIIDAFNTDLIEFNRDGLPAGLYMIELKGSQIYRGKIIIE